MAATGDHRAPQPTAAGRPIVIEQPRSKHQSADQKRRAGGRDQRRRQGDLAGQHAGREAEAGDHHGDEVDRAGDEEEGDRAPADPLRRHPDPLQRPGAEREPAGAAGRQQHVGRLLRHRHLVAEPPREPPREDAAEGEHEGQARAELDRGEDRDQHRVRPGEPLAQVVEPRHRGDRAGDQNREQRDLHQSPAAGATGKLALAVHVCRVADLHRPLRETGHEPANHRPLRFQGSGR